MPRLSLAFALLPACVPATERWAGTCGLDAGGAFDFDVSLTRTWDWYEGDAVVRCDGHEVAGEVESFPTPVRLDTRAYTLSAAEADVAWSLSLLGEVQGDALSGECSFNWRAEADFAGDPFPGACMGAGEFTADRE